MIPIQTHKVATDSPIIKEAQDEDILAQFHTSQSNTDPISITVLAKGRELQMEVDTGASVSVISEVT